MKVKLNNSKALELAKNKWGNKVEQVGTSSELRKIKKMCGYKSEYVYVRLGYVGSDFDGEEFQIIVSDDYVNEDGYTLYALL